MRDKLAIILAAKVQEMEFGLLELGRKYPELNRAMEDTANFIVSLHGAYDKLERAQSELRIVLGKK